MTHSGKEPEEGKNQEWGVSLCLWWGLLHSGVHSASRAHGLRPHYFVLDSLCTWFECVSMLVILLNCVTLGMYQPCDDMDCLSDRCKILQVRPVRPIQPRLAKTAHRILPAPPNPTLLHPASPNPAMSRPHAPPQPCPLCTTKPHPHYLACPQRAVSSSLPPGLIHFSSRCSFSSIPSSPSWGLCPSPGPHLLPVFLLVPPT